jgi:cytoskeleton protein RodZ
VTEVDAGTMSPGDGPGPLLRRAREGLGLTEQQAAEQLNLDATMVRAIENDDLAALGAPVFARGHLRRYGSLLGLPADTLLAAYERAATQPSQPSLVPHSRQEMAPVRSRPRWPWAIGGALLFLLAAGFVAYVSEYGLTLPQWPASRDEPAPAALETAGEGELEAGFTVAEQAAETGARGTAETPATGGSDVAPALPVPDAAAPVVPVVPPGHVSVSVSFAADSWAEIYDGAGQAVLYDLGRAGTQRTIAAAAPLSVTFGNAPGVTLVVNGRATALPQLPAGQSVARFTIAADGSLR